MTDRSPAAPSTPSTTTTTSNTAATTATPTRAGARGRDALMRTYAEPPVTFVRGQGTLLFDAEGNEYLDFITGLAVVSLGHAHPAVADAVAEQARTLCHVSNLYGNTLAPEVASTIDRLINGGTGQAGGQVFFANSGAEANECALKLARRWAGGGRHVVISTDNSFHGRTLATLTATGQPEKQEPFRPLPEGFVHVPYDDVAALDEALDADTVAAVLLEPLQGEGGVMVPSSDYLGAVRSLCTERNALLMLDEVQTGLGRTGHWFAFQAQGLEPDVVTMAKALGNGMPVGACWARAEVAAAFGPGDHGSTFGGQPLALAAAKATLTVMEEEDVCGRARLAGARLARGLGALPGVESVRGAGLLLAAQLSAPVAKEVVTHALQRGLLVNAVRPDAVRMAPPLLVSNDEVDATLRILGEALAEVTGEAATSSQRVPD
jgi:acetylornithine/N-succinyldiaminopimelate aminotransferase